MKLFNPQQGQRIWYRSADRELDVYELQQILEFHQPDGWYVHTPHIRALIRRSNRNLGPTVFAGPDQQPFAGCP